MKAKLTVREADTFRAVLEKDVQCRNIEEERLQAMCHASAYGHNFFVQLEKITPREFVESCYQVRYMGNGKYEERFFRKP